jgi:proteasome lid subunit RPN8/RPN11
MRLTQETISAISKQAVAEYPAECCGIVTASAAAHRFHPCRNRQDELLAKDPEQNPRTNRDAYDIDRNELEQIFTNAKAAS